MFVGVFFYYFYLKSRHCNSVTYFLWLKTLFYKSKVRIALFTNKNITTVLNILLSLESLLLIQEIKIVFINL